MGSSLVRFYHGTQKEKGEGCKEEGLLLVYKRNPVGSYA
tara:strand:- start:20 stop:136 length:117 start_codon:yes stop_codon:yes gene_type:complete